MRIHRHRVRKPTIQVPAYRVNERIEAEKVRVIDGNTGESFGVLSREDALKLAAEREKDLVEVSPKADPPVCKILEYGQFRYQKEKELRKQKAQSKEVEIKGIRLSVRIGDHDMNVRRKQASKFLDRGDKVKVELVLRGREKSHREVADEVINRFVGLLKEDYELKVEQPITYQRGRLTMIVGRS